MWELRSRHRRERKRRHIKVWKVNVDLLYVFCSTKLTVKKRNENAVSVFFWGSFSNAWQCRRNLTLPTSESDVVVEGFFKILIFYDLRNFHFLSSWHRDYCQEIKSFCVAVIEWILHPSWLSRTFDVISQDDGANFTRHSDENFGNFIKNLNFSFFFYYEFQTKFPFFVLLYSAPSWIILIELMRMLSINYGRSFKLLSGNSIYFIIFTLYKIQADPEYMWY